SQPAIDRRLQHRATVARATALAVDDAHAVPAMERGLGEERAESGARLVLRHPVQVNLVAYGIFAAPQPAQDRFRDAVAAKGELVPGLDVEVVGVEGKRIR